MNKHELINLTLKQLIERFRMSPESFEYSGPDVDVSGNSDYIIWQPKVILSDSDLSTITDPNNNHAIIIQFNHSAAEFSCYIFLNPPPDLKSIYAAKADCLIHSKRSFEKFRGNYKKFKKLKNMILKKYANKENRSYLKKLSSVFPDIMDDYMF